MQGAGERPPCFTCFCPVTYSMVVTMFLSKRRNKKQLQEFPAVGHQLEWPPVGLVVGTQLFHCCAQGWGTKILPNTLLPKFPELGLQPSPHRHRTCLGLHRSGPLRRVAATQCQAHPLEGDCDGETHHEEDPGWDEHSHGRCASVELQLCSPAGQGRCLSLPTPPASPRPTYPAPSLATLFSPATGQ